MHMMQVVYSMCAKPSLGVSGVSPGRWSHSCGGWPTAGPARLGRAWGSVPLCPGGHKVQRAFRLDGERQVSHTSLLRKTKGPWPRGASTHTCRNTGRGVHTHIHKTHTVIPHTCTLTSKVNALSNNVCEKSEPLCLMKSDLCFYVSFFFFKETKW